MIILEENHHRFLIVEHDPLFYENAGEMVEYQGPQAGLPGGHHPALRAGAGPHLQKLTELADRVFCIYSEQAPAKSRKAEVKKPGAQATLETYS